MTDENPDKAALKEAWLEGYKRGRNVEEVSQTTIQTAERQFERWWAKRE